MFVGGLLMRGRLVMGWRGCEVRSSRYGTRARWGCDGGFGRRERLCRVRDNDADINPCAKSIAIFICELPITPIPALSFRGYQRDRYIRFFGKFHSLANSSVRALHVIPTDKNHEEF